MQYDLQQYINNAKRTEAHLDTVASDPNLLFAAVRIFISAGAILDFIKKNAFYGKEIDQEKLQTEFANIVGSLEQMKPAVTDGPMIDAEFGDTRLFHSLIGVATEATELLEAFFSDSETIDTVNILEEFGDLCWYLAIGIDTVHGDFGEVLDRNIAKLRARFPEKYSDENAINRDVDAERKILEGPSE